MFICELTVISGPAEIHDESGTNVVKIPYGKHVVCHKKNLAGGYGFGFCQLGYNLTDDRHSAELEAMRFSSGIYDAARIRYCQSC